jgi:hypothetical protein
VGRDVGETTASGVEIAFTDKGVDRVAGKLAIEVLRFISDIEHMRN